ncbi:MAG: molecular chaperone TorD family protein [Candidatus Korarchaeota archaeon]|nr:molecular chaperone TorD family protein [Candidatus Korarchaeota archaeon]
MPGVALGMGVKHSLRADMYWLLSHLYAPPTDECGGASEALARMPSVAEGLRRQGYMLSWRPVLIEDCSEHSREYTRLFVLGDPSPLCPPYESIMLGYEHLMSGPAAEIAGLYRAAGFHVPPESPLPPEHVAVELEFMYILALLDENREVAKLERLFLSEHLGRWIGRFSSCVEARSSSRVFRQVARLTREFVAEDRRALGPASSGKGPA